MAHAHALTPPLRCRGLSHALRGHHDGAALTAKKASKPACPLHARRLPVPAAERIMTPRRLSMNYVPARDLRRAAS